MIARLDNTTPVLVIAAHADDEVLGCGGTLAMLSDRGVPSDVIFLADGESSRQGVIESNFKSRRIAAYNAMDVLGIRSIDFLDLPDNRLDTVPRLDIIQEVESRMKKLGTKHIISHTRWDVNIDHQIAHEVAVTVARPFKTDSADILSLSFFEVLSSSEWRPQLYSGQFTPTSFVCIEKWVEKKIKALRCYEREMRASPHPRSETIVRAQSSLRGSQSGMSAAEAFEVGRTVLID